MKASQMAGEPEEGLRSIEFHGMGLSIMVESHWSRMSQPKVPEFKLEEQPAQVIWKKHVLPFPMVWPTEGGMQSWKCIIKWHKII